MAEPPTDATDADPRRARAQRYLQAAERELASKQASLSPVDRRLARHEGPVRLSDLRPVIAGSTYIHLLLLMPVATLAALALVWCYVLLDFHFIVGRIIALPTGVLVLLALSYASAYYLGLIESTSHGETCPDDALRGDWRDWFWLLPSTVGMLALAAGIGYLISVVLPWPRWQVIGVTTWLVYPVLQLSSLETGSPLSPFSGPIFLTLITRPLMWMSIYAITFAVAAGMAAIAFVVWRDPPYLTVAVMGPLSVLVLSVYGLVLGTAARWLSLRNL